MPRTRLELSMSKGFLIDTNVLPELMRDNPVTEVLEWFRGKNHSSYIPAW